MLFLNYALVSRAQTSLTLREAYKNSFLIGVAVKQSKFSGEDQRGIPIIQAQFHSITAENVLKWESVHPAPGHYDFAAADRFVEFGEQNGMFIIGHTLVWHSQTPRGVFQDAQGGSVDRDTLLNRMSNHIHTVVGRYKGRIKGWDVVNEALNDDGSLRQSPWLKIIGEDFIAGAFEYAHEADPQAQLHYNDYSLENPAKRKGAMALIRRLQARGVHLAAIGSQDHVKLASPTMAEVDATLAAFGKLGVKVMITELDVDVNPAAQENNSADVALNFQTGRARRAIRTDCRPQFNRRSRIAMPISSACFSNIGMSFRASRFRA